MLYLFDQNYSKNSNIVKYYYNFKKLVNIFDVILLFCNDGKATFSISLLQSSVSHDPSEIILMLIWYFIISVENGAA